MRYVMIDTNIFIDMIIDRKHNVSDKLVESFIKLLDYDEIKLVIPAIVVHETNKHIDEQLSEVGKRIVHAIKALDDIYGINGYEIEGLEIKEYKNNSKKQLNELLSKYESKKEDYLQEVKSVIKKVFEHKNCIIIEDTEQLRSLCMKRRIYKKAPFHIEKKESYADGMIVETLLHLQEFVTIEEDDNITFVTGNTSDFSSSENKRELHKDILEDLVKIRLDEKTKYILSFSELIGRELAQEVQNANLKGDFEKEMQEQEEYEKSQWYSDIEDMDRESAGLTALGSFEDEFLDSFRESSFAEEMVSALERLNRCYSDLEEITLFYDDELQSYMNGIDTAEIPCFIKKWNKLMEKLEDMEVSYAISGIKEISEWIEQKIENNDYTNLIDHLPDSIDYGDKVVFYGVEKKKYELSMDELFLSCKNGEQDWLEIDLFAENERIAKGNIEITYGFVEFDDDGGVADACDEDIDYQTGRIIESIIEIVNELEEFVGNENEIVEEIRNTFDIW